MGRHIIHHRRSSHLLMSAASPSEAKPRRRQNVSYIYNAAIMLVTHEHSLTVNKPEMWTYMINQWHLHPNLFWPHSSSCTSSGSCAEGPSPKTTTRHSGCMRTAKEKAAPTTKSAWPRSELKVAQKHIWKSESFRILIRSVLQMSGLEIWASAPVKSFFAFLITEWSRGLKATTIFKENNLPKHTWSMALANTILLSRNKLTRAKTFQLKLSQSKSIKLIFADICTT